MIKERLRWRVGNGLKIKIWGDQWLPILSSYKVQSLVKILYKNLTMSALIDKGKGCWDSKLINEVMDKEEAAVICGLPLSKSRSKDKMFWKLSKHGLLTVKSAYY